jgi:hypothetical protein
MEKGVTTRSRPRLSVTHPVELRAQTMMMTRRRKKIKKRRRSRKKSQRLRL